MGRRIVQFLLDTDTCIYAIKKRSRQLNAKIESEPDGLAVSTVSLFELYFGASKYDNPEQRHKLIEEFTANIAILPFDQNCSKVAGLLRYELAQHGKLIGPFDIQIAATALNHSLTLVTGNTREFSRVEGLRIETWR